ncbi:MAG: DUF2220 domain-containing protein [Oscillospiraceae bacterium]|nr:DUF2220 domain-containing protein [Oscillospiraceae bacterium]
MSTDYKKKILTLLVNWYEGSPAYVRGEPPSRRRIMRLYDNGKTDFPLYDIENHIARKDINQAVFDMAEAGLVGYEWMRGQRNHIISGVWLRFEKIDSVYDLLERTPKGDEAEEAAAGLERLREMSAEQWVVDWADEKLADIRKKRSIGNALPTDASERGDLLKALSLLGGETEVLERVFSIRCFGDSKRFERTVKSRLIRIVKKYLAVEDNVTDEAALRLVGLSRYPEQFEFSGAVAISLPGGEIDYSPLPNGGALTNEDLSIGSLSIAPSIRRILSIENKANYVEYVRKGRSDEELVLFHGGQYSPAKRLFLQQIVAAMPDNCLFSHWGDIDFGGFSMLARLRREIFPDVRPYLMGKAELLKYADLCAKFDKGYADKLSGLLRQPELADCAECIEYMLEMGVRLEQEAMLL